MSDTQPTKPAHRRAPARRTSPSSWLPPSFSVICDWTPQPDGSEQLRVIVGSSRLELAVGMPVTLDATALMAGWVATCARAWSRFREFGGVRR